MPRKTKFELSLRAAFERTVGPDAVTQALGVIAGDIDPRTVPAAAELERQCYNPPGRHYLMMTALDSLLGTCGVEYLGEVNMYDGPPVEYLNAGYSYADTLVWFRSSGRFYVKSWGDVAEANPQWCR